MTVNTSKYAGAALHEIFDEFGRDVVEFICTAEDT
jgi:hypothetical protein